MGPRVPPCSRYTPCNLEAHHGCCSRLSTGGRRVMTTVCRPATYRCCRMVTCHRWVTQSLVPPVHQPPTGRLARRAFESPSGAATAFAVAALSAQRRHSSGTRCGCQRQATRGGRLRMRGSSACGWVCGGFKEPPCFPSKVNLIIDSADLSESVC